VGTECDKEGQNQCETGAICTSATKKGKKEDYKCTCHPKTEEKSGICGEFSNSFSVGYYMLLYGMQDFCFWYPRVECFHCIMWSCIMWSVTAPKPGHAKGECMLGNKCIDGARCVTDDIPKVCQCEGQYPFHPDDYTCSTLFTDL